MLPEALRLTDDQLNRCIADYKYLHSHPELSGKEHRTADWIARKVEALGYHVHRIGETGVAAVLSNGDGPTVAFRADMDALPIKEETGVDWASTVVTDDGQPAMHACGHDIHMACGLYTAELFASTQDQWSRTLEFIFQPSEENVQGSRQMIADGLWDTIPHADIVYGQHVWPIQAGLVTLRPGTFFSIVDAYRIDVQGRGGHGSMPESAVDAAITVAAIATRLNMVRAQEVSLQEAAVLTVGAIHAGSEPNIIADTGYLTVSTRTYSEDVRARLQRAIERITHAECKASGGATATITRLFDAQSVVNDPQETTALLDVFRAELGQDVVNEAEHPMTASEDFGYLAAAIDAPSVFWTFGGYEEIAPGQSVPTNHSPKFLPTPAPSLATGVRAASAAIWSKLGTSQ